MLRRARRLWCVGTSFLRRGPDFVIIGAQRGGTTSLYSYLLGHPLIEGPRAKELHYFDLEFSRGRRRYLANFPVAARSRHLTLGEATPYYLFHPHVPARLAQELPNARLIALLRDPVDRALSHYHHEVRLGVETLPLLEALDREDERLRGEEARMAADPGYRSVAHQHFSYVARGRYADQLDRWWRHVPPERLLVLRSEDLFTRPHALYDEVLEFLGLPAYTPTAFPTENGGVYAAADATVRRQLAEAFASHTERLESLLGRSFGWTSP
jgi:Sulfotransferase domain